MKDASANTADGAVTARVLSVQPVATGESVGYGSRWTATRPSRIGVLACGYADGYPRVAPGGTPVWVGGRRPRLARPASPRFFPPAVFSAAPSARG